MFNVKQLKINKCMKYICQLIICTSNATLETPSLRACSGLIPSRSLGLLWPATFVIALVSSLKSSCKLLTDVSRFSNCANAPPTFISRSLAMILSSICSVLNFADVDFNSFLLFPEKTQAETINE